MPPPPILDSKRVQQDDHLDATSVSNLEDQTLNSYGSIPNIVEGNDDTIVDDSFYETAGTFRNKIARNRSAFAVFSLLGVAVVSFLALGGINRPFSTITAAVPVEHGQEFQQDETVNGLSPIDEIFEIHALSSPAPPVDAAVVEQREIESIMKSHAEAYFKDIGIDPNVPPPKAEVLAADELSASIGEEYIPLQVGAKADSNYDKVSIHFTGIALYTFVEATLDHGGEKWRYEGHLGGPLLQVGVVSTQLYIDYTHGFSAMVNNENYLSAVTMVGIERYFWHNKGGHCQYCQPYDQYAYAWTTGGSPELKIGAGGTMLPSRWKKVNCWQAGTPCVACDLGCCRYDGGFLNWSCD